MVGYGARQHIRKNALQHLHQEIAITRKQGSITLEESLARLVRDGVVEVEEARARAAHPEEFENYLRGAPSRTAQGACRVHGRPARATLRHLDNRAKLGVQLFRFEGRGARYTVLASG